MRVGVTGGAGFIAGALVPHLAARGHDLVLIDNHSGPLWVEHAAWPVTVADFAGSDGLDQLGRCDIVLHLGAVSGVMACAKDPVGSARINVDGTRRLAERCADAGIPIAFASSFAVVGAPERLPVTESTPPRPTHEYARQKAAGEEIVLGVGSSVPTAVLRMSNLYGTYRVYGGTVAKGNVISLFVEQAVRGVLTVNAPGTQRRDFIHIDDVIAHWEAVVEYLRDSATRPSGVRFNVASGEAYSVLEIAERVRSAWGAAHPDAGPVEVRVVPNPREGIELVESEFAVDRSRTEEQLGVHISRRVDAVLRDLVRPPAAG